MKKKKTKPNEKCLQYKAGTCITEGRQTPTKSLNENSKKRSKVKKTPKVIIKNLYVFRN